MTVARPSPMVLHEHEEAGTQVVGGRKIRVFVLDDHEIFRLGLRQLLDARGDFEVAGESGRARGAADRIAAVRPDVALLDARLPDGSGIDVCREVVARCPGTVVLILTSFEDDTALFGAIDAGASGFLLKQVRGTSLVAALRRGVRGHSTLDHAVTDRVVERLRRGPNPDPAIGLLTSQERRVLWLIGEACRTARSVIRCSWPRRR